ncbi:MAG TPA: DUF1778 domain-containing protein [Acidimicrobiales bacterium]|nr:DUF1778 domain-containing protein [Acidimicrobiales bacterium]
MAKDRRRELRLSSHDDDLIAEAAGLCGVSVSEFLLNRAVADAEVIVATHHTVRLNSAAYEKFLAALDAPAQPVPALVAQIRKAKPLKHVD